MTVHVNKHPDDRDQNRHFQNDQRWRQQHRQPRLRILLIHRQFECSHDFIGRSGRARLGSCPPVKCKAQSIFGNDGVKPAIRHEVRTDRRENYWNRLQPHALLRRNKMRLASHDECVRIGRQPVRTVLHRIAGARPFIVFRQQPVLSSRSPQPQIGRTGRRPVSGEHLRAGCNIARATSAKNGQCKRNSEPTNPSEPAHSTNRTRNRAATVRERRSFAGSNQFSCQ